MRLTLAMAVACLSLGALAAAGNATAAIRQPIDIPAEGLAPALNALAKDRNFQIVYVTEEIANVRTEGAIGEFTTEEALKKLLTGTGLTYRYLDDKTVTVGSAKMSREQNAAKITSSGSPDDGNTSKEAGKKSSQEFRVAQVDQNAAGLQAVSDQNSGKKEEGLAEIVVTARKREERLIDVPMSIVAVSGDELQQRQITSLQDLPAAVPGFAVVRDGNVTSFEIRGVSNGSGTGSLVGVYVDEADTTVGGLSVTQVNPITYDLERVEVLRGPQGTLYGDGSEGGTIRLITKNPNLSRFSLDSQIYTLFTQGGQPGQRVNAMVNVPLIENQLGLRVAATYEHDGGWIDLAGTDQRNINSEDLTNVRIKGLWQPNAQVNVSAMAIINRDLRALGYSDNDSPTQFTQALNFPAAPRARNDYDLYNLTLTYDLAAGVRILNSTTYIHVFNPEFNAGTVIPQSPPGTPVALSVPPYLLFYPVESVTDNLGSDELRLTSTGSGRWQWTAGIFYKRHQDMAFPSTYYFGQPPRLPPSLYSQPGFDDHYTSWSAFGDTSYRFGDRFTLGAGVRYFDDKQDFFTVSSALTDIDPAVGKFHSIDPRFYAQFKVTPDVNLYTSAAKGFRSGGFNGAAPDGTLLPNYAPESVWTYELGTKMAVQEGRIALDMDVFWTDYDNFQTFGITSISNLYSYTSNAGKARIKGIDGDLTWRPLTQWRLDIRGEYLDTKFLEVNTFLNSSAHAVGDQLDYVPRYQLSTSAQRDFLWLNKQGFIRLDYSQQGPMVWRNRSFQPWYYAQSDVIHLLGLRASLRLSDNLNVGFSAQNLLNDQGFVDPLQITEQAIRSRPRTFGVDFSAKFE
jgi:iron complex outermembrane receptor protein